MGQPCGWPARARREAASCGRAAPATSAQRRRLRLAVVWAISAGARRSDMEQLLAMGFPPHKCKQAMGAAGNVDGAVSYIFANEDKPESFWQPTQSAQSAKPAEPAAAAATVASADSVLAKLQQALSASREESSSFGRRVLDWLGSPAPEPPPKLLGDLEVAPPLSDRRKHMFTASRFADMAGVSPYGLPHSLWLVMTGREPADEVFQGNEATQRGQELEPVARRAYELRFAKSAPPCDFVAHPEHIWLGATPDGVVGEDGLLEIKCPMHKAHEEVPLHYMAQVQGQLEIMDRAWCDFVSWQPDRMVVIHVPRSREYWAWLYPLLERFYAHVLSDEPLPAEAKTPPPPPAVEIVTLYDGPPPVVTAKLPVTPAPGSTVSEADSSDQLAAATHTTATAASGRGRGRGTARAGRAAGVARATSGTDAWPGAGSAASAAAAATAVAAVPAAAAAAAPAAAGVAAAATVARGAVGTDTGTDTGTGTATRSARVGLKRTAESVSTNSSPPAKKTAAAAAPGVGTGQPTPTTSSPATADAKTSEESTGTPAKGTETGTARAAASAPDGAKLARSASARGDAGRSGGGGTSGGAGKNGGTTDKNKQGKDGGGRGGRAGSAGRGRGRSRARGGKGKGRGK